MNIWNACGAKAQNLANALEECLGDAEHETVICCQVRESLSVSLQKLQGSLPEFTNAAKLKLKKYSTSEAPRLLRAGCDKRFKCLATSWGKGEARLGVIAASSQ
jgi:hypothetical protein